MKTIVRGASLFGLVSLALAAGPGGGRIAAAAESSAAGGGSSQARKPTPAPAFDEKDIFGKKTVALKNYLGKVVVLNFWATWCGPCKQEIPALKEIQAGHEGEVQVIGVAVFSSDEDTERYTRDQGIDYPVFYGSFELMEQYDRVRTIPTTFIIDRKGALKVKVVGARTREQYEQLLEPLLKQ